MSSLRLEEKPVEFEGRTYVLRCNMAVLDALQEAHGGDFAEVMQLSPQQAAPEIFAAMLNDYAEDMGWEERWTRRQIAKRISYAQLLELDVLGLFTRGLVPATAQDAQAQPGGDGGN